VGCAFEPGNSDTAVIQAALRRDSFLLHRLVHIE
jgi:hypothetical protein